MRNILLTIEYDGTAFSGWQKQPEARTVQGELESALSKVCGCEIKVNGTSRTDAGVHALGQCASFSGDFGIPTQNIMTAVNNMLSGGKSRSDVIGDVRVTSVTEVPEDFHARFNCKGKTYRYIIRNAEETDIFKKNYCYQIQDELDIDSMREAASHLVGTHDFKSFQASGGEEKETTVRTIESIVIEEEPLEQLITIEVTGDGFLYNMVRIIVGTLVEIGLHKREPSEIPAILSKLDRQAAGHTAPAGGLYLKEIYF